MLARGRGHRDLDDLANVLWPAVAVNDYLDGLLCWLVERMNLSLLFAHLDEVYLWRLCVPHLLGLYGPSRNLLIANAEDDRDLAQSGRLVCSFLPRQRIRH